MDRPGEIRFDGWTLVRGAGELLRDGRRIRLQDQPLQILEELLAHPGQLVTRENLIARLWPTQVVEYDMALNAAVRRLRAALGDEAETPRFIETIPRRGYRFVGRIEPFDAAKPAGPQIRRFRWRTVAGVLVVVALLAGAVLLARQADRRAGTTDSVDSRAIAPSVAVLPFLDLSTGRDQQHFADGLTEELINILGQAGKLNVTARTSSFSFRDASADIPTVATRLNVSHVVEGSVRVAGGQVRVTARLIDAGSGSQLWSQAYDRKLDDIFEVQAGIAASIARALRVAVDASALRRPRVEPGAYEDFLRGHFFFQRRAPGDIELARQYYQHALDIDPGFARAWAGLAGVYWIQTTDGSIAFDEGLGKLRAAARRAAALDPRLPEAHLRLVNYYFAIGNEEAKQEHRRIAIELAPNDPLVLGHKVGMAAEAGRLEEAVQLSRRIVALDPLSAVRRANLAYFLLIAGRLDEAQAEIDKAREMNPADNSEVAALLPSLRGRFDEAIELLETWPDGPVRTQGLALAYHGLGRRTEADAALRSFIDRWGASEPFRIAVVYSFRGETDEAFRWLNTAVDYCGGAGPVRLKSDCTYRTMAQSPFLKHLHADPRWKRWLARKNEMA